MKKQYEKPAICVVQIYYQDHLLTSSPPKKEFVDDPYDNWDSDGGQ